MALFQNQQWAVTDWGLTSIRPGAPYNYEIAASRLLESGSHSSQLYDWPAQLAEKTWIDLDAFIEAFRQALVVYKGKYEGLVDDAVLERSIVYARSLLK